MTPPPHTPNDADSSLPETTQKHKFMIFTLILVFISNYIKTFIPMINTVNSDD
jgi:hypothetical protein